MFDFIRKLILSKKVNDSKILNKSQNEVEKQYIKGTTLNSESAARALYSKMFVDTGLLACIRAIRHMDRIDTRVKKIHRNIARDATKGGVRLVWNGKENTRVTNLWKDFRRNTDIRKRNKLISDAKGLAKEGSLAMQWVINEDRRVISAVRMPIETIIPQCGLNGQFENIQVAYKQVDPLTQTELCSFALWQLTVIRLDPDNYDDRSCMGRPYLDATRPVWKKLTMTEEDLVVRRGTRAPQKLAHNFSSNTSKSDIEDYQARVESETGSITTDFYGKDFSVTAIGGDASLDQIADVVYLLDTFFAGAPAPKSLFGYTSDLSRDLLEDLKKDYFEEIDSIQDILVEVYQEGFELQLLLAGLNPAAYDFSIVIAERQTESRNQKADLGLKFHAMGQPMAIVNEFAGVDHQRYKALKEEELKAKKPYPDDDDHSDDPPNRKISITPSNARKGDSATSVSNN